MTLRLRGRAPWLVVAAVLMAARLASRSVAAVDTTFLLVAIGAAIGAWIAAARSARALRPVPQLIAAGLTLSALGDVVYRVYYYAWGTAPDVSLADVPWLASYVALTLALAVTLIRARGRGRLRYDVEAIFDVLAVTVVSVLLLWQLAVEPILADGTTAASVRVVWSSYPFADAILLALVLRVLISTGRGQGRLMFSCGAACWLLSDLAYLLYPSVESLTGLLDVGWMLGPVLLAHSIKTTEDPRSAEHLIAPEDLEPRTRGVAIALLPLLVPGGLQVMSYLRDEPENPIPLLGASAVLVALAFARTTRLIRSERQARAAVRSSRRYYERLAANSSDAVIVLDRDGRILNESPQLAELVGHPGLPTAGVQSTLLVEPDDVAKTNDAFARAIASPGELVTCEMRVAHACGEQIWLSARARNLLDDPDVQGIVVTLHDVTARKRAEDELSHQAFHDSLTGLANRSLFRDRLEHAQSRNARTGADPAVLYVDLDGFKHVNDTMGHEAGDDLLRIVAQRLGAAVREGDTVARLGGDEFAILLEATEDAANEAALVAERCLEALDAPADLHGVKVTVGGSIGIAIGDGVTSASSLLRNADIAMYRAKVAGKGQWVAYDPTMRAAAIERLQLETDLANALAGDELRLVYQPVVELESQNVVGFEALLRWDHPTLGVVSPDKFVPIAEENGLIVPIGEWVLRTACETGARWQRDYPQLANLTMAINLSARQLASPELVVSVAEALAHSGLRPESLVLEMTETTLIHDPVAAAARLRELRHLGLRLAIDDFGTGYSSLSYLRQFPVDILKIDRSFVNAITDRSKIPAIVRGLLDLGRTLQLEMIAEGVEDDVQRDGLRAENCDFAQGYLFARPLDAVDAEALLSAVTLESSAP